MAFREFGKGFESMETFSRIMNMTKPINIKAYNAFNDHLLEAYLVAADNSMSQAATEVKEISEKQNERALHFQEKIVWQAAQFPLMGHGKNEGMIPWMVL